MIARAVRKLSDEQSGRCRAWRTQALLMPVARSRGSLGWMNELYRSVFTRPKASGYTLLNRRGDPVAERSYVDLVADARQRAADLRPLGPPGTIVALVFADPLQFVAALFACLFVGLVPIPVAPRSLAGLVRRLVETGARAVVVEVGLSVAPRTGVTGLRVQSWPLEPRFSGVIDPLPSPVGPDDVCLIQLSSGTTGEPRCVGLTATNVCSNERLIAEHFGHGRKSRGFGWLPHTHDMGLFGTLLQPFFVDCPGFLARPTDFVREPLSWLRCVSRCRATSSGAPTFAYRACADAPGSLKGLDLSDWRVAFVGAEPVRASVLRRFSHRFAPVGFDCGALMACYGLAEATLLVTGERPGEGLNTIRRATPGVMDDEWVCVGDVNAGSDVSVRLGDQGRYDCPEIGEVLVAGPSVARSQDVDATGWLHTGDLGFIRDERLYVCGRLKDVVKVRGRSVALTEVDRCVEETVADPTVEACAFAVSDPVSHPIGEEDTGAVQDAVVVLVQSRTQDVDLDPVQIAAAVRGRMGLVATVHCVGRRPRLITRTASGKVNRTATRKRWLRSQSPHA